MTSLIQRKWFLLAFNVVLTLIIWGFFAPERNLFQLINVLFYISFFYIVVGTILILVRGRLFISLFHKEQDQTKASSSTPLSDIMIRAVLFQGVLLAAVMVVSLVIYY
ncbi:MULTISPECIES: hypothetical protein [Pontibacillus]|uniref:DUF3899 domain-containing protein n=1 Tax=Pontibacillus chungwhensis TaxID=265426 RepID=A0ABY8UZB4_9BACI|nr:MULTISPECIES: hypothetical protein [Pontibacillus]MCD5324691.1 hypothetical protein [Pontibacillus sp. HN14]WIF99015.1 hypothetical protein QNI29_05000 [Pontibacillus chungwhensis]